MLRNIYEGEPVIKYEQCIGFAKKYITNGEHVHSHNLRTSLGKLLNYTYNPKKHEITEKYINCGEFEGYVRHDGRASVRNKVWIIPTVGCVNEFIRKLCAEAKKELGGLCDGFAALKHPYSCFQLGDDQKNTQKVLSSLVNYTNAGTVLIVSLGCENNNLKEFLPLLGEYDKERVKTLTIQSCTDEFQAGMRLLRELAEYAGRAKRTKVSFDNLVIGLKCWGSDAFSGITENPLCGCFADKLIKCGGTVLQTEVPEMFGAEQLLMDRAVDEQTFEKIVFMINDFKKYYISHNRPVYENPSSGNKEGGITTPEEKSLGCVQKSGTAPVRDVLPYAKPWIHKGLNLVYGPENDIVSTINLVSAGAQIILFTTERGTSLDWRFRL